MHISLHELGTLDPSSFPPETPTRIDVDLHQCVLPLLVVRRSGASRVLVLSNGAVDLERSQGEPVFQRSTWWESIHAHQIYVCDPGTVGAGALGLSWGQISAEHWAVPHAAQAVQAVSSVLGIPEGSGRTYFGSSAGGFWSLGLAGYDHGAQAVVNNAQFDWTKWMPTEVNALRQARFQNLLPTQLRAQLPQRTNVLTLLRALRNPLRIRYFANLGSKHDRLIDYPMFQEFLVDHSDLVDSVEVYCYVDKVTGHNPLPRKRTLSIINDH